MIFIWFYRVTRIITDTQNTFHINVYNASQPEGTPIFKYLMEYEQLLTPAHVSRVL